MANSVSARSVKQCEFMRGGSRVEGLVIVMFSRLKGAVRPAAV